LNAVAESGGFGAIAAAGRTSAAPAAEAEPKFCSIDNPECEACQ
jgi:ribonucleoside-diphosphate reductase alpha chain